MKEKIAFPQLVELVAAKASTTSRMSELFLQEFFATVSQALSDGKSVKIKGLGSFLATKTDGEASVQFTPNNDLAEVVNAPFAQFKPVELCDEMTDEQLADIDASMEPKPAALVENVELSSTIEPAKDSLPIEVEQEPKAEFVEEPQQEEPVLPREDTIEPANFSAKPSKRKWLAIAAALAAIALIAGIATLYSRKGSNDTVAKTDTIAIAPSAATTTVTDTLRNNNSLLDMAKRHYGDKVFWVYIALENQQQYPNYKKIPKESALTIPAPEKYGINSDSKQSLRKAAEAASELKKSIKPKILKIKNLDEETTEVHDKKTTEIIDKKNSEIVDKKKDKKLKDKHKIEEDTEQNTDIDSTATSRHHKHRHH